MQYSRNLTDLLNNCPEAYELFYALPPETQTSLQQEDIRCLSELELAIAEAGLAKRPKIF